jgi:hypothetical protein
MIKFIGWLMIILGLIEISSKLSIIIDLLQKIIK